MAELLKREGYEPLTASDFDSALAIFETAEIDAAVVDIIMPRKGGIELLKELRSRDEYIPVIMITGEPNISQLPEIVRAGAYDFISKPVTKDSLIRAVSNAVEKKRLLDERRRLEQQIKRHAEELEVAVRERTRELAEAHNFLNAVLDSSTEYAIVAIDIEGRFTLFNRGAELMFGYNASEATGYFARDIVIADARSDRWPLLDCGRASEIAGRHQEEMEMHRADGGTFVASVTMTPIRAADGNLMGYLGIIKDLTVERRNAEHIRQMRDRLAHNEKIAALGRMAAQVAHEVRNPLAGLKLYSLHLKNKVSDKLAPNENALIDKIIDGINQLSETTEKILSFARPVALTRRPADLNQLVKGAVPLLEPQLAAKKIRVNLDLSDELPRALFDEAAMRSTLINLMLNSIQAMNEGGELTVTTRSNINAVQLEVADNGRGMTAEQMANIFEPFYTTSNRGLGLGMSFVQKIVEQHEGTVEVDSRLGEGTRITITLPVKGETVNEASGKGSGGG